MCANANIEWSQHWVLGNQKWCTARRFVITYRFCVHVDELLNRLGQIPYACFGWSGDVSLLDTSAGTIQYLITIDCQNFHVIFNDTKRTCMRIVGGYCITLVLNQRCVYCIEKTNMAFKQHHNRWSERTCWYHANEKCETCEVIT